MTALSLDLVRLEHALKQDAEFVLQSRYLTATIRVVIGESQSFRIVVREGQIVEIDPLVTPFDSYDIQLAGTEEQWGLLLAPIPPPFYQDFYSAMLSHGFRMEGDMEMVFAYYPALRRLGEIFRSEASGVSA